VCRSCGECFISSSTHYSILGHPLASLVLVSVLCSATHVKQGTAPPTLLQALQLLNQHVPTAAAAAAASPPERNAAALRKAWLPLRTSLVDLLLTRWHSWGDASASCDMLLQLVTSSGLHVNQVRGVLGGLGGRPGSMMFGRIAVSLFGHLFLCLMQHSTAQHSTAQHSTAQHSTAQHSTA
jgi:hypothetical protein